MKKLSFAFVVLCIFLNGITVQGQKRTSPVIAQKAIVQTVEAETLEQQIGRISREYGLDARLFQSLIYTESVFKIRAVSYKGAACYTQLMPDTARRFGLRVDASVDERFNPEKCLRVGAYYLAWLLKTFRGDVRLALAGYNAGEGAVMKYGWRIPPFRETVQYVEKICALYFNQSGHGVAMAYNQPQAQAWVTALYTRNNRNIMNIASVRSMLSPAGQPLDGGNAEQQSPVAKESFEVKKPVVNRVNIEESTPRIRTQSLSFGN